MAHASRRQGGSFLQTQLRIYRIAPGHLEDFVRDWSAGVPRLRRTFGFEVEAWTEADGDRFIWLVRWPGPGSFADADARYYASPARKALHPDPARWIVETETYDLTEIAGRA
jgi:hypothetical protein